MNMARSEQSAVRVNAWSSTDKQGVHPDLQGGQTATLPHGFDHWQLEAVSAICDTFVPSLPVEASEMKLEHHQSFYQTSASDAGVPAEVVGLIFRCLDIQVQAMLSWILWLLSTRAGTLLLCGRYAICGEFPYVHRFAKLPLLNRENTMRSWSTASIDLFQSLFKLFKCYCMYSFFTKADAVWKAIGYLPPNPTWNGLPSEDVNKDDDEELPQPLQRVFDMRHASPGELKDFLRSSGFSAEEDKLAENEHGVTVDCDVVVVGSGAGGGASAALLAQKGHKVIILEKGNYYCGQELSLLEGPSMQTLYEGGGLMTTRDGGISILAGSSVGGGTTVNWSASLKTPESVIHEWSKVHGLDWFASRDYTAAMDKVCDRLGVCIDGNEEDFESFQNAVLRKGCRKLGLNVETIPRNCRGKKHRCGYCGFGCRSRQKQGTNETWLRDAVEAGAVILSGCTAEKVALSPGNNSKKWRAEGVLAKPTSSSGNGILLRAKATVVSCGALHTPILLRRSGLTNSHIGSNLHLHPTYMAWGYFPPENLPPGVLYDGPIMTAVSKLPRAVLEVPSLHPGSFSVMTPWRSGSGFKQRALRYSRTAHVIVIAKDESRGTVRGSRNGSKIPVIGYKVCRRDEETLRSGVGHALRVLIAAGAEEVGIQEPEGETLRVGKDGVSEKEVERFVRRVTRKKALGKVGMLTASAHQMGSCRMGVSSSCSAVDPRGETWEASGLFVADASLFPTALGVNPMITVQSVAVCIAEFVDSHCMGLGA